MNKRVLIVIGVAAALVVQIALAVYFWSQSESPPETAAADGAGAAKASGKAVYHNLRPPFVVTLPYGDRQFMLQADLAVMAHEPAAIDAVIRHGPLIRADVIGYLSDLDPELVQSKDGKQDILHGLTATINGSLEAEAESVDIDTVLFNNLVMQ